MTEDEMVGWLHRLNGHEFEQTQEMVKDKEAWRAAVHGVRKSWTQLMDRTTTMNMEMVARTLTPHAEKAKLSRSSGASINN